MATEAANLFFDPLLCVRGDYQFAECRRCADACGYEVFSIIKNRIVPDYEACVGCGGCVGGCPSEALGLPFFDPDAFALEFVDAGQERLSCKTLTPCLAVFDTHHFVTMGLRRNGGMICDLSYCEACEHNRDGKLSRLIRERIAEAQTLVSHVETAGKIMMTEDPDGQSPRRGFFKKAFGLAKETARTVIVGQTVKEGAHRPTGIPFKTVMLRNTLKEAAEHIVNPVVTGRLSFVVGKAIDGARCTNCGDCSEFCPTAAISTSTNHETILFQSGQCVACGICNQKCPEQCISDVEEVNLVDYAFNRAEALAQFQLAVCLECRVGFVYRGGEQVCPRCLTYRDEFAHMFKTADELE